MYISHLKLASLDIIYCYPVIFYILMFFSTQVYSSENFPNKKIIESKQTLSIDNNVAENFILHLKSQSSASNTNEPSEDDRVNLYESQNSLVEQDDSLIDKQDDVETLNDLNVSKENDEVYKYKHEQLILALSSSSDINIQVIPNSSSIHAQHSITSNQSNGRSDEGSNGSLDSYSKLKQSSYRYDSEVEGVDTPFLLRQGTIIPSILLSSVNSDLPGQILAQVTDDVLDSPLGNHILIPRGSKLVGQYGSSPDYGQERLMMGFNRIIFPDGKAMDIGAMPGTGTDGFAGADAHVNNHLLRLFTSSVLLAGVGTTTILTSQNSYNSDGDIKANSAFAQSLSESLGQTATKIIERNLNVSPTLEVKAGYSFNVTLIKDLRFKGPYKAFDDYS